MLKKIPKILSPTLVKTLMEMGHSDEIVIADGNFPSSTYSKRLVSCDGLKIVDILNAVLELFPLDTYSEEQVVLMSVEKNDSYIPTIWNEYKKVLDNSFETYKIKYINRMEFYERAKKAYAVVSTGEEALYANIILKKGVVK